ncbi:TatD family hydrolase [Mycoplasmoides pirum]|uniref:TatD family hydrolase n=1 Tax=Mycoplasmoides pirum TaxID=2122 RepID=UPI000487666D|nr:TatD family hydrolase [Mycoplasmoides pirum]
MSIYDSHTHPNLSPLSNRLEEIIDDCKNNNIYFNVVGVDIESSKKAIDIANKYSQWVKACIAIHPNDVQNFNLLESEKILNQLCIENKNVISAIGECGLDFYYSKNFMDVQYKFLLMQTQLAKKHLLPIMFHVRNAHMEIIDFIKKEKINVPIIIHCFSENLKLAQEFITLRSKFNIYLSIPGIVTFKNAIDLQNAVKIIPLDMLLVETDAPWLTPTPFRGKENKPLYSKHTIEKIANLKNISFEEVKQKTFKNAMELFRK